MSGTKVVKEEAPKSETAKAPAKAAKKPLNLQNESVWKLLIKLSIPGIVSSSFQALYNLVDSIFVAQWSKDGLSAISVVFPFQMLMISIAVGNAIGALSFIARSLGRKDMVNAKKAYNDSIGLAVIMSTALTLLALLLGNVLTGLFTDQSVIQDYAADYLKIVFFSSMVMMPAHAISFGIRAQGNTWLPMIIDAIGIVLNLIIDPFLIFGIGPFPEMGIRGAGWATFIGRSIALIVQLVIVKKIKLFLKPDLSITKMFQFSKPILKGIAVVGVPAAVMQSFTSVLMTIYNVVLTGYGDNAIAAGGAWFRIFIFALMPSFGIGQGAMPIIGFCYGAKNMSRMLETMKKASMAIFFTLLPISLIYVLFPDFVAGWFVKEGDDALRDLTSDCIRGNSWGMPLTGPMLIAMISLQAQGLGLPALAFAFVRDVLAQGIFLISFNAFWGLDAFWYAMPLSWVFSTFLLGGYFYKVEKGIVDKVRAAKAKPIEMVKVEDKGEKEEEKEKEEVKKEGDEEKKEEEGGDDEKLEKDEVEAGQGSEEEKEEEKSVLDASEGKGDVESEKDGEEKEEKDAGVQEEGDAPLLETPRDVEVEVEGDVEEEKKGDE